MTKRTLTKKAERWRDRARSTAEATDESLALWRPAWETVPAGIGAFAALYAGTLAVSGAVPPAWGLLWAGAAGAVAAVRFKGAVDVWRRRAPLSGFAPLFMSMGDVVVRMRAMRKLDGKDSGHGTLALRQRKGDVHRRVLPRATGGKLVHVPEDGHAGPGVPEGIRTAGVWFGQGFVWTPAEAQKLYELSRVDWRAMRTPPGIRAFLTDDPGLSDRDLGLPVIHGAGPEEEPIERPISSLGGGTLVVGTTQAGKGVVLTCLVSQAILRGEAVIVIDPKSSRRLSRAVRAACRAAGREAPLEFHPAFPGRGIRLDPLGSFTRSTEIASRIMAVLPPDRDGAFTSFAWQAVHVMTEGLLFAGERPTLMRFRTLLELGVEDLLEKCLSVAYDRFRPGWRDEVDLLVREEGPSMRAPFGSRASLTLLAMVSLWERNVRTLPNEPAVTGLISVFRHSREHYAKITASLVPALAMLTSGELGRSLSPDSTDGEADGRPVHSIDGILEKKGVLYLGLDALPDAAVAGALGSLLLADLAAAAGRRYNAGVSDKDAPPVSLFVDETANVINGPLIEILNKGLEAGITTTCAMQTVADLESRLGSSARARMVLGNLNNLIALRTKDQVTQEFICEAFGRTTVWESASSVSTTADDDVSPAFRASVSHSLSGRRDTVVPMETLGSLPNLEYFACLSGGRLWKGRMPILLTDEEDPRLFEEDGSRKPGRGAWERVPANLRPWFARVLDRIFPPGRFDEAFLEEEMPERAAEAREADEASGAPGISEETDAPAPGAERVLAAGPGPGRGNPDAVETQRTDEKEEAAATASSSDPNEQNEPDEPKEKAMEKAEQLNAVNEAREASS